MKASLFPLIIFLIANASELRAREFTDSQGRKLDGELLTVVSGTATIKRNGDGKVFTLPVTQFSTEDQKFMADFKPSAARFNFDVKYTKDKLGKTKTRQGEMQYETEEWAYKVALTNRSSIDAADIRVDYYIFRRDDDGKNRSAPRVQVADSVQVPLVKKNAIHNFQTRPLTLNKEQLDGNFYHIDGSRNKARDTVGGLALRVYQGEEQIFEWATDKDLLAGAQKSALDKAKAEESSNK